MRLYESLMGIYGNGAAIYMARMYAACSAGLTVEARVTVKSRVTPPASWMSGRHRLVLM